MNILPKKNKQSKKEKQGFKKWSEKIIKHVKNNYDSSDDAYLEYFFTGQIVDIINRIYVVELLNDFDINQVDIVGIIDRIREEYNNKYLGVSDVVLRIVNEIFLDIFGDCKNHKDIKNVIANYNN